MKLTDEQLQIINHPIGAHGKVLSVAGSGKTTTMAHRVKHLVENLKVNPSSIQVLMFNRDASTQFQETMIHIGFEPGQRLPVNTFHSYAFRFISRQQYKQWFGETEELMFLNLNRAIAKVRSRLKLNSDFLDTEYAKRSIELWKAALIPTKYAAHKGSYGDAYVEIYKEFERLRREARAITYDDFVPEAVNQMQVNYNLRKRETQKLKHIIVDEYQDINYGQQKLIELMASEGADVLVVGDDDQTIYEWRGARTAYILREFQNTFNNKRHIAYKLTHSFRFGYSIAQSSYNVISHNPNRFEKSLVAYDIRKNSDVTLYSDSENPDQHSNRRMTEEILSLVIVHRVKPSDIRVLGRTYSQLDALSTDFMNQEIPFKVIGGELFLRANECQALLDYVRVANALHQPLSAGIRKRLLNIANKPSRYLRRQELEQMIDYSRKQRMSIGEMLKEAVRNATAIPGRQQENLQDFQHALQQINHRLTTFNVSETSGLAMMGPLLAWIDKHLGFCKHYEDYYGEGDSSFDRITRVNRLIGHANYVEMDWREFINYVDNVDPTLKKPENEWIKMMTVHKTKGLEFDYVFIPNCTEGYMPVISNNDHFTFDKRFPQRDPAVSEWVENERRLFYVALTRAKKAIYVGTTYNPSELPRNQPNVRHNERKPSRFLEELELPQTLMVSRELVSTARGEHDHRLIKVCQDLNAYHHIVRPVKDTYSQQLSLEARHRLAQVKLKPTERPFTYKLRYDTPSSRFENSDTNNDQPDQEIWAHIKI